MSSNDGEQKLIPKSNPDMDDTEDGKPDDYYARMQELGFMDQYGRWTDKGIRECLK